MDFRPLAKRRLPEPVFNYIDGGADDELTLRRNTSAFDEYELLPSQLSDVSNIETSSTLFGEPVAWPVMIAPTGASKLFHGSGECAVARAAERLDMFYSLSTLSTATIEDVAAASGQHQDGLTLTKREHFSVNAWVFPCDIVNDLPPKDGVHGLILEIILEACKDAHGCVTLSQPR